MNNTTYIIEVRHPATTRKAKFFKSSPNKHGQRIRTVGQAQYAKQFSTEIEAAEVVAYLKNHYYLHFTIVEKTA